MNAEFFAAIEDIEKEKGIPREYMYDKIRQAMLAAFRRDHPENEDNVEIILDEDKKRMFRRPDSLWSFSFYGMMLSERRIGNYRKLYPRKV